MSAPRAIPLLPAPRPAPPGRARNGAFTLLEVITAVGVFALALTTSITTMQRAFSQLDTARNFTLANSILQAEMEKERLFTWAKVSDTDYTPSIDAGLLRNPNIASRFSLSRSVTTVAGRTDQMVQVTLTVRWRSYDGQALSSNVSSNFTNGGLNDLLIAQF